ncbi:hypothetical protein QM480_06465 [Flectobacillus sp. DC10W]|uniref:Phage tail protein n=1 Tax=Flectobacillus longus TaxID=2984207 RepID=A0ABT6YK53_9BACT|nr:hypothetical protein [Flectobacillus longus]MDI9863958.1 hypothetical protein [Flectobacillus longus]
MSQANGVTIGLEKVLFGEVLTAKNSGASTKDLQWIPMESAMRQLGLTNEGSAVFDQADPDTTDFKVEEQDTPIYSVNTQGKVTFTMEIADPSLDTIKETVGGEITYSSGIADGALDNDAVIEVSGSFIEIRRSVLIKPKVGFKRIVIPNGLVSAKLTGQVTKTGLFLVTVVVTPTKLTIGSETSGIYFIAGKSIKPITGGES